ncbi:MAG TPA: hypothetical protein VFV23_02150 [Verrucomicrobiae bacterium]|nr:hypothetical protein [Verrucomicrobiae bacterium]
MNRFIIALLLGGLFAIVPRANAFYFGGFGGFAKKPTVTVVTPKANQHLHGDTLTVSGKAAPNGGSLTGVYVQLNGGGWVLASTGNGWKTWFATETLDVGTNVIQVYATNSKGKTSATKTLKCFYDTVTVSLAGTEMTVNGGDYVIDFGTNTFSMNSDAEFDLNGVGTYSNTKLNGVSSKLKLTFTAPPTATNNPAVVLNFDTPDSGSFTDDSGDNSFTLDPIDTVVPGSVSGILSFDDGSTYSIPESPLIAENPNPFKVKNPLTIWIDQPYPGSIGDRVSVKFTHLVWARIQWVEINEPTGYGTVIGTGTTSDGTDTVTVLFDNSAFVSKTDLFAPISGLPVNIMSFTVTNSDDSVDSGQFTYKPYSPVGALFTATTGSGTSYDVLNFADDSSGNYTRTSVDLGGNVTETNAGTFSFTLISNGTNDFAPSSVVNKTLVMTNSGGFYESVQFTGPSTFNETNSYNSGTNSDGNYAYSKLNSTNASARLTFTSGPTLNFTNFISVTFTTTNFGTFTTTNYDDAGNLFTNYNGNFRLQ